VLERELCTKHDQTPFTGGQLYTSWFGRRRHTRRRPRGL